MNKIDNIKKIIADIRLNEGVDFDYDENAILSEYKSKDENKSSLAIKILSIFGGFLATLFFVAFLLILGLYDSEIGLVIFGGLLIVSAIWMNKQFNKLILDTFSISMYAIGFVLIGFGLEEYRVDENIISILFISISISSLFITQNYMLSFISILVINGSFLTLINLNNTFDLIHLYIAFNTFILVYWILNESKIITSGKKLAKLYNPLRIGLLISLLLGLSLISNKHLLRISENYIWIASTILFFAVIYLVYTIIDILKIESTKKVVIIYSLSVLLLIPTVLAPSISGAILIILLCFMVNYKTGFVIGITSLIYFVSQYYYDLNFTLLTKSIILFSSGIVFIAFYLFTNKTLNNEKI